MKFSLKAIFTCVLCLFYISTFHTIYSQDVPSLQEFERLLKELEATGDLPAQAVSTPGAEVPELPAAPVEEKELEVASFTKYFDINVIPAPMVSIFRALKIRDYAIIPSKNALSVKGTTEVFGGVVNIELMCSKIQGQEGVRLKFDVPTGWKLSRLFPSVKALDQFVLPTGSFVISSQEYLDPNLSIPVKKGLTFISEVRPEHLKIDSKIIQKAGTILGKAIDKLVLAGYIPTNVSEFDLKVSVPIAEDKEVMLADFVDLQKVSLPDNVQRWLATSKLINPQFNFVLEKGKVTDILLKAGMTFFDNVNKVDVELAYSGQDFKGFNFKVDVPPTWKLTSIFPSIKVLEEFTLPSAQIFITDKEYMDPDLFIMIQPGFTLISEIRPADLKIDTKIMSKIGDIAGKVLDKIFIKLHIPKNISDFDFKIELPIPEERVIRFSDLIDAKVPMPPNVRTAVQNIKLVKPQFVIDLEKGKFKNAFISGGMNFFGQDVVGNFYLKTQESGKVGVSATLTLSSNWEFADAIPQLAQLDGLKLSDSRFIISSFDYTDERLGIEVKEGFTFESGIELTGALEGVKKFIDKILTNKKLQEAGGMAKTLVLDELSLRVHGSLKPDVTKSEFVLEIPIQIGIDFAELHRLKKIKGEPIIKKLTTSRFKFIFTPDLKVTANAGIFLYPKGQEEALEFMAGGGVSPQELSISGRMVGAFDPAFGQQWLSFADLGLELVWNYELSAALAVATMTGIPFPTGVTMAGSLGLGKVPNRTTGKGVIKLNVTTTDVPDFFISGEIDQINITELIKVLISIGTKPVNIGKLPKIIFSDLKLMVAPFNTVIFDKEYKAGIDASAKLKIDDFLAAGHVALSKEDERLLVEAFVTPFKTKVFELTGGGPDKIPETEDDGAAFKVDIAAGKSVREQQILIDGMVVIPPIKYKGSTLFEMAGGIINGSGTGKWLDVVNARASFRANIDDPLDWALDLNLESGFSEYLKKNLPAAFAKFKEQAQKDIKKYDDEMEKTKKGFASKSQAELDRVNNQLKKLNDELRKIKLTPVGGLGAAGPSLLHIFNYSPNTLYVGLYYSGTSGVFGQKSVGPSVLSGSILSIPGYSKAQLSRPGTKLGKNRDIIFSFNRNDLKNNFTKEEFVQRMYRNVGELQGALFHIYRKDVTAPYRAFGGVEWDLGPGAAINIKIAGLATEIAGLKTYRETLLKPGSVVVDRLLEGIQKLKAIPTVFVQASERLTEIVTKASGLFNLRKASLVTSGPDLKALKLPKISLNLQINIKNKNIVIDIPSLQFDVKNPQIFFNDLAGIILTDVVQGGYDVPLPETKAEVELLEKELMKP